MSYRVRAAVAGDCATLLRFIRALADYEHMLERVEATEDSLHASLFTSTPAAYALIIESESGEAVGFAVYFYTYSTWRACRGLFLEDLFILPEHRGQGMGSALLATLAQIAEHNGCVRFEWNVLDWNEAAIRVYRGVGAGPQSEWTTWRLDGERLSALAANASLPFNDGAA